MNKKLLALMVILLSYSCTQRRTAADFIDLGKSEVKYNSVDDYLEQKKSETLKDNIWVRFMFLNNPYNLNDDNLVSIYVNYHLVYRGAYKRHLELNGSPDDIFVESEEMIITMEILTDKKKNTIWQHSFQSKTRFSWNKDYKIIYCGFFPTNENIERVYFIPQLEPMI